MLAWVAADAGVMVDSDQFPETLKNFTSKDDFILVIWCNY